MIEDGKRSSKGEDEFHSRGSALERQAIRSVSTRAKLSTENMSSSVDCPTHPSG